MHLSPRTPEAVETVQWSGMESGATWLGFKSEGDLLPAVWPWASFLTSLFLSFSLCQMVTTTENANLIKLLLE